MTLESLLEIMMNIILPSVGLFFIVCPPLFVDILNKKTCYKKGQPLEPKLFNLFWFFWLFCFLFIKKIKHKRKIQYMNNRLAEINMYVVLGEDTIVEKRNIEIFLKLNKIKKRL